MERINISQIIFIVLLIKKFLLKKKKSFTFFGSAYDKRGYSHVDDFVKILYKHFKKNKSFIIEYGNKNLLSTTELIKIYNKQNIKKFNKIFTPIFKKNEINISMVKNNKNSIYSHRSSKSVINKYLIEMLNEKKM